MTLSSLSRTFRTNMATFLHKQLAEVSTTVYRASSEKMT